MTHYLFRVLVVENKLVTVDYFMDKMQTWEISNLFDALQYCDKNEWERTRMLMYVTAQVNSTKKLKITDILKLPWDEHVENYNITNDEIDRLKNRAQIISDKYIQNK